MGPAGHPGVQPGGFLESDGRLCTPNFVFRAGDEQRFIGTAGHCILGEQHFPITSNGSGGMEQTWTPGTGPEAKDAKDRRIGEFAYAVLDDRRDFALIRLDPHVAASPQVAFFGGPTGMNDDHSPDPVILHYYGNGVGLGITVAARSAVALGLPDPDHISALGLAVPGDSGAAVISADGRAVGVLVSVGVHAVGIGPNGVDAGTIGITRLAPQLARAQAVLGIAINLETALLN